MRLYLYSFRGVKIVDRERRVLKQIVECTEVTEKPLVDPMSSEAKTYIWRDIGKEFLAGVLLKPGPAWIVITRGNGAGRSPLLKINYGMESRYVCVCSLRLGMGCSRHHYPSQSCVSG